MIHKILFKVIPEINVKFNVLRRSENPFANFVTDLVRKEVSADCCLLSSGSLRADCVYPVGHHYTYGDMFDIYPFDKELCLIEVTGDDIYNALEDGVCKYPSLEGRFPQVKFA